MSKLPVILAAIGLATTAGIASAAVSGDPQNGKEVANLCVACHQADGSGNQGAGDVFPGIAGQHAGYIDAQLKAWKEGTRKNETSLS